ncbi:MAG TPA: hypothetical protein VHJ40_02235 [Actinomycetota bacterium]|nr:hypothetical protein [Actinomycetota bacterium]
MTTTLALLSITILAQGLSSAGSWAQSRPAVSLPPAEADLTATAGSPTAAATAAPSEAPATPPSPGDTRTGRAGRLDPGMVRTLALVSIVVAAIAGLYVYRIIRKGL